MWESSLCTFTQDVHHRRFIVVCTGVCHRPCFVLDKSIVHHHILLLRCLLRYFPPIPCFPNVFATMCSCLILSYELHTSTISPASTWSSWIMFGEQLKLVSRARISPSSCHLLHLGCKYLNNPVLGYPEHVCRLLRASDHVSRQVKLKFYIDEPLNILRYGRQHTGLNIMGARIPRVYLFWLYVVTKGRLTNGMPFPCHAVPLRV